MTSKRHFEINWPLFVILRFLTVSFTICKLILKHVTDFIWYTFHYKTKKCLLIVPHTSKDSFYKWTKISSLEINIFGFKNDSEKWSGIYFEIHRAPSEIPANLQAKSVLLGRFFGTGHQQLWRGLVNFKIKKKSKPLFTVIQKCKFQDSRF